MAAPSLARRLRAGETTFCGWSTLPEPLIAEYVARAGFDCVALEMQHGFHDVASVIHGISAVALTGKPSVVRIPVADNANASRFLDLGAEAIIAPMINSVDDARALVAATKYPPLGERSWGPLRTMALQEIPDLQTQLATANGSTVALAMIETKRAFDVLDDILAIDGIDGVFVGPSDLSVTFSDGKKIAPTESFVDEPIRHVAKRTIAAGKITGVFAVNAARARQFREWGYRLIALGSDQIYLADGAKALLTAAKA